MGRKKLLERTVVSFTRIQSPLKLINLKYFYTEVVLTERYTLWITA
jgi:hypothetical protein